MKNSSTSLQKESLSISSFSLPELSENCCYFDSPVEIICYGDPSGPEQTPSLNSIHFINSEGSLRLSEDWQPPSQ